ncbi:hypothetical protein PsYK624_162200 [Phanerochaete sordida]|uniref:Uncharacterized protein n=1 Tax=Phanerochaete sordida TaxID=48140 RepID=A0A9P3GT02_9APHY|nr:hypothetical protein PsYK624_162200 [Phanerochaete sordida]
MWMNGRRGWQSWKSARVAVVLQSSDGERWAYLAHQHLLWQPAAGLACFSRLFLYTSSRAASRREGRMPGKS